jgi:hypothetical protein
MLFNYFLSRDEYKISPIPDKIITVGKKPKTILEKNCNFPQGILKEGCALRYEYLFKKSIKKRTKNKIILAGFSIGLEESVTFLNFLLKPKPGIQILLSQNIYYYPFNYGFFTTS